MRNRDGRVIAQTPARQSGPSSPADTRARRAVRERARRAALSLAERSGRCPPDRRPAGERLRAPSSRSQRVRAFEQLYLPVSGSLSRATIIKVGQLVGAADVVVGSYRVDGTHAVGDRPQHSPGCRPAAAGGHRAGRARPSSSASSSGWPTASAAGPRERCRAPAPHPPLDAFENYIKGLLAESPVSQASFLEAALRDAPRFDRARLALWEVRTEQADHVAALEAVRAVPCRRHPPRSRRVSLRASRSSS